MEHLVRAHQATLDRRVRAELTDRIPGVGGVEDVLLAPIREPVDLEQLIREHRLQQHAGRAAAKVFAFGLGQDLPPHRGQHYQSRYMGGVYLRGGRDFSFVRHYNKVRPRPGLLRSAAFA